MHQRTLYAFMLTAVVSACGSSEPPPPPAAPQGRAETQGIRNTEAIGYSGNAIANKVDGALNQNDQQRNKMDEALKKSEQQ
jgi:hypothetical protein